jgi:hypothetical protein
MLVLQRAEHLQCHLEGTWLRIIFLELILFVSRPDPILSKNRVLLVMNMLPLKIEKTEEGWKVEHQNHLGSVNPTFRLLKEREGTDRMFWYSYSNSQVIRNQFSLVGLDRI